MLEIRLRLAMTMLLRNNVSIQMIQQAVALGAARKRTVVFTMDLVVAAAEPAVFVERLRLMARHHLIGWSRVWIAVVSHVQHGIRRQHQLHAHGTHCGYGNTHVLWSDQWRRKVHRYQWLVLRLMVILKLRQRLKLSLVLVPWLFEVQLWHLVMLVQQHKQSQRMGSWRHKQWPLWM